jgi:hypothetical protein
MKLSPHELGMLHMANMPVRRVYLGRKGCELSGYQSGRWWTALSLWMKGYLKRDGRFILEGYGSPAVYLVVTEAGKAKL